MINRCSEGFVDQRMRLWGNPHEVNACARTSCVPRPEQSLRRSQSHLGWRAWSQGPSVQGTDFFLITQHLGRQKERSEGAHGLALDDLGDLLDFCNALSVIWEMKKECLPWGDAEERMELDSVCKPASTGLAHWCERNVLGPLPTPTALTLVLVLSAPSTLGGPRFWVLSLFWTQMPYLSMSLLTSLHLPGVHTAYVHVIFLLFSGGKEMTIVFIYLFIYF